jgi:Tat protein translocase TatB subunit
MFNIGSQELLVILIIALIVVGPQRLPELSRSIGKGLREFRKVQDEVKDMVKIDLEPEPTPVQRKPASPTAPGVHRTPKPATAPTVEATPPIPPEGSPTAEEPAMTSPMGGSTQEAPTSDAPDRPADDPTTAG